MPPREKPIESKVETAKRAGRQLRGDIAETLASETTHFAHDDVALLKFHGVYQQDDRDARHDRADGAEKAYSFMARVALPAGILTADQYLAFDDIADRHANGTLRITTRQGLQYHGVLKGELKPAIAAIHHAFATTLAACGDVQRNVMGCPAPLADAAHQAVQRLAGEVAAALRPASRAYHEIWLDGERYAGGEPEEPFYGTQYLPRKFKTAVGLPEDNCVDLYAQDAGLLAILNRGAVQGFNVLVGGGLGMTHGKGDTLARLAEPLGYVSASHGAEAIRIVVGIFRDHGNRADRRHARLKYLLNEWGIERFREEFRRRASFELAPAVEVPPPVFHDHLGAHEAKDGSWFYGVFVLSGRVVDTGGHRLKQALRKIAAEIRPGFAFTAQQSVLLTGLRALDLAAAEKILGDHGIKPATTLSAARRFSLACPALPTCGLAVAESERLLPALLAQLEAELEQLGRRDTPFTVRMTGCPNGCARPYTADLAFVGRSLDLYHIYVGGRLAGDRMADLYQADVRTENLMETVRPLLTRWAREASAEESLGDFYQRMLGQSEPRQSITGRETPTIELVSLGSTV